MKVFPRNIFQVWYQGCENVTKPELVQNIQNWKAMNPEWSYHCVSHSDLQKACGQFSEECLATYNNFENMHMKIDFGRYVLLYLYGGIYVDMDAFILRNLESSAPLKTLIDRYSSNSSSHVMGFSSINLSMLESLFFVQKTTTINNAILVSSPKTPLLKLFIESIIEKAKSLDKTSNAYTSVQNMTGPKHFNKFFWQYIDSPPQGHTLDVFPCTVFEPCMSNTCDISPETVSIHTMDGTWIPKELLVLKDFYFFVKDKSFYLVIGLIVYYLLYRLSRRN